MQKLSDMAEMVIHISEVLKIMNHALLNHESVSFKAWKLGKNGRDPERGTAVVYDSVYVSSHSKTGMYKIVDPLSEDKRFTHRNVCEAFIFEFLGKKVIW